MSDGLDRTAVFKKKCTFSNSIKITQNNVLFSYFIKLYEYWGNFQSSYEKKIYGKYKKVNPWRSIYVG